MPEERFFIIIIIIIICLEKTKSIRAKQKLLQSHAGGEEAFWGVLRHQETWTLSAAASFFAAPTIDLRQDTSTLEVEVCFDEPHMRHTPIPHHITYNGRVSQAAPCSLALTA